MEPHVVLFHLAETMSASRSVSSLDKNPFGSVPGRSLERQASRTWRRLKVMLSAIAGIAFACVAHAHPFVIAVIPMGSTHEYWKAMHAGALKAESELNQSGTPITIIWKGPLREDDREMQVQVLENFVGRQVDGIVLAPLDKRALVGPVEEAVGAHIPVVLVDSNLNSDKVSCLVATDNLEGGRIAARCLGGLLAGRGNVILLRVVAGSVSTEQREAGFLEVMHREYPDIDLISTDQYVGVTRDTSKTAVDNLLNRFGARINGIFAPNESSAVGTLLALRDAGLAHGKVKFVGFDSADVLVAGLESGDIQGLVVQDPFKMGYLGVKAIATVLQGGKVPSVVNTDVTLVTPSTMKTLRSISLLHPAVKE
jgi:ribose transport system substrate-binding protein